MHWRKKKTRRKTTCAKKPAKFVIIQLSILMPEQLLHTLRPTGRFFPHSTSRVSLLIVLPFSLMQCINRPWSSKLLFVWSWRILFFGLGPSWHLTANCAFYILESEVLVWRVFLFLRKCILTKWSRPIARWRRFTITTRILQGTALFWKLRLLLLKPSLFQAFRWWAGERAKN